MRKLFLILIIALAFFLRVYHLSSTPPGLTWDEAALGYNAYSILRTGKDEFGKTLPIIFKSFGDYKPGFYVYLAVPSVAIFGLNEFSVRLPSAIMGTIAVLFVYLLVSHILSLDQKTKKYSFSAGIFAAFILALSPLHIHFSHGAWETNVFSTLLLISIYFFYRALEKKFPIYPTFIFILASLYTYQAAKLLVPLVFVVLIIINHKAVLNKLQSSIKTKGTLLAIPVIILCAWFYLSSFTGGASNRLAVQSLLGYRPPVSSETKKIDNNNDLSIGLFHNQIELTSRLFLTRYLNHFAPTTLFYEGPVVIQRGHIPRLGAFYLLDAFLMFLGLIFLVKSSNKTLTSLLLALILLSPIPASLTLGEFSTIRAEFMIIPLAILAGLGVEHIFLHYRIAFILFIPIYLFNVFLGLDLYFNHSFNVLAKEFNYGYKQAIQRLMDHPTKKVVFTDVLGQPYIYYLFYTQYDPAKYQKENDFIDMGIDVGRVGHIGNVQFQQFSGSEILNTPDAFFIGSEGNINNNFDFKNPKIEYSDEIRLPNNDLIFRVVKTKAL